MATERYAVEPAANPELADWLGRPITDPIWRVVDATGQRAPAVYVAEQHAREHAAWLNARAASA